jgi:uncharacterized membrane protein YebE (DUF533 family)
MDAKNLLDQVLQSGKKLIEHGSELVAQGEELASNGLDFARRRFKLPDPGPERDQLFTSLGASAAAGGILALLLGTRRGRSSLSQLARVGSVAALGGLGHKIYSDYQRQTQQQEGRADEDASDAEFSSGHTNPRCLTIVQAMIAASKADGVIDEVERKLIENRIRQSDLDSSVIETLLAEIAKPLDVSDVAQLAKTPIDGVDIYLASLLVIDPPNELESKYLSDLSTALDLHPSLVQQLQSDAFRPI